MKISRIRQVATANGALLTAAICLVFSPAAGQDNEQVVRVDSSIVVLNATIRDAQNKPLSGLRQPDFKVLEDGVPQEITFFEAYETPFAAVILFDTSGSMSERVSLARSATIQFLDGLRADDVAAIYKFDTRVEMVQDFSDSRDVSYQIFELKADGMTALNDAICRAAAELQKRPEKRKAIVVLSDGADTFSKRSADKALDAAQAADATIYTVDMTSIDTGGRERMQNQGVLKRFAEKTGGMFIPTGNTITLRSALRSVVEELRIQYTLGYVPSNLKADGKWRALELRVARPDLTIRTRRGYNAPREKR